MLRRAASSGVPPVVAPSALSPPGVLAAAAAAATAAATTASAAAAPTTPTALPTLAVGFSAARRGDADEADEFAFCPWDGTRFKDGEVRCVQCGASRSAKPQRRSSTAERPGWKKLLYKKQGFPDNYVDTHTFLDELKRNGTFLIYDC